MGFCKWGRGNEGMQCRATKLRKVEYGRHLCEHQCLALFTTDSIVGRKPAYASPEQINATYKFPVAHRCTITKGCCRYNLNDLTYSSESSGKHHDRMLETKRETLVVLGQHLIRPYTYTFSLSANILLPLLHTAGLVSFSCSHH